MYRFTQTDMRYRMSVRLSVCLSHVIITSRRGRLAQIARITTARWPVVRGRVARARQLASTNNAPLFTLIKRSGRGKTQFISSAAYDGLPKHRLSGSVLHTRRHTIWHLQCVCDVNDSAAPPAPMKIKFIWMHVF